MSLRSFGVVFILRLDLDLRGLNGERRRVVVAVFIAAALEFGGRVMGLRVVLGVETWFAFALC
jgi:hypothetical protein